MRLSQQDPFALSLVERISWSISTKDRPLNSSCLTGFFIIYHSNYLRPRCLCYRTDSKFFLFFCCGCCLYVRDHSNFVNCVRFSPDGSKFITVSSDKSGIIYDAKTAEKIGGFSSEDGHKGSIYALSWSPDGKQVKLRLLFSTQEILLI